MPALAARLRSFAYAFAGVRTLFATQPNFRIHTFAALLVVVGGFRYTLVKRDVVGKAKPLIIDEVECPVLIVR